MRPQPAENEATESKRLSDEALQALEDFQGTKLNGQLTRSLNTEEIGKIRACRAAAERTAATLPHVGAQEAKEV